MRRETKGLAEFRHRDGCAWYRRLQPANRPPKGGGTAGLHNRFSSFVWLRLRCSVEQAVLDFTQELRHIQRVARQRRRQHTPEFKAAAVERMRNCDNIVALSRELRVNWRRLYRWKDKAEQAAADKEREEGEAQEAALREENLRLKAALADKVLEVEVGLGGERRDLVPVERDTVGVPFA